MSRRGGLNSFGCTHRDPLLARRWVRKGTDRSTSVAQGQPSCTPCVPLCVRNWHRERTNRPTSVAEGWPSTRAKRVLCEVLLLQSSSSNECFAAGIDAIPHKEEITNSKRARLSSVAMRSLCPSITRGVPLIGRELA